MSIAHLLDSPVPTPRRRGRKPAMANATTRRLRYLVACRVLCEGVTREAIARELQVSPRTIYTWIRQVLCDDTPEGLALRRSPRGRAPQSDRDHPTGRELHSILEMQTPCDRFHKRSA